MVHTGIDLADQLCYFHFLFFKILEKTTVLKNGWQYASCSRYRLCGSLFILRKTNVSVKVLMGVLKPFPKQALVLRVCSTSLLKTLWEKEKLFVLNYFSSVIHSVFFFYPSEELSTIFIKSEIFVCKLFQFGIV